MNPNEATSLDAWLARLQRGHGSDAIEHAVHAGIRTAVGADKVSGNEDIVARRQRFFSKLEQAGVLSTKRPAYWMRYGVAASIIVAVGLVTVLTRGVHPEAVDIATERGVTDVLRIHSQNVPSDTVSVRAELVARNIAFKVVESSDSRSVLRLSISTAMLPAFRAWAEGHGLSVQGEGEYRLIIGA